ncbi:MAG: PleD family two-component system response regulator [Crocosphaera sp.]
MMPETIPKETQSLYSILREENYSGCIKIRDPIHQWLSWELYCHYNYIYYATSSIGQKERLKCLWKYLIPDFSPPTSLFTIGDYENITNWWQSKKLPLSLLHKLISYLTQEALAQILIIDSPILEFLPNRQILSPITHLSCQKIVGKAYPRSEKWKQFSDQQITPFHRLYLDPDKTYEFYQFWKSNHSFSSEKKPRLSFWLSNLSQKYSLYELAADRGILPLTFLKDFDYLLKCKIIEILPFDESKNKKNKQTINHDQKLINSSNSSPLIACIDDSITVHKHIKKTLAVIGYQTLSLTNPTLCLSTLARYNPSLILLDINMPEINGYELCSILKKSSKLRNIPIVMVTGRDGIIDRIRAKQLGVKYYLTKPYNPQELIEVVKNLANVKSSNITHQSYLNSS